MRVLNRTIFIGNTFDVSLVGLRDERTESAINDATVTATLFDSAGDEVAGAVDVSLSYEAGTQGVYVGTIPHTIELVAGRQYILQVTASAGDAQLLVRERLTAAERVN